ncbi:PAS domain S-box protein [Geobacter pelophilus]|uniref:histidine kinase n=1 Tax=Geoanaerobacter pelophilus TaxID=60036 RepID=A0AAW4KZ52_9BACT|nr:PAS domain S-box protein [Geoanaerobacter pelophilus]MBT0663659.1 PAS domain S-box protein [Geoanaerobacter pelophilus]
MSNTPKHPFIKQLITGVMLLNLVVAVIILFSLAQSKHRYDERAAVTTQNLTQVLDEALSGIIAHVDVAILAVVDEAERQLASGAIDEIQFNNFIIREKSRLPELIAFRATDASGDAIYGPKASPVKTTSLAQRDYFAYLRDNPKAGLVISKPLVGGISGKWMVVFSRRVNRPDGAFAGLVYAGVPLDHLTKTFSKLNVGKNGVISLIDSEFSLVARYPDLKNVERGTGQKVASKQFIELIEAGKTIGTYTAKSSIDSLVRIYSFRTIALSHPFYIFVGLATSDYLAEWHTEIWVMSLFMSIFLFISVIATRLVLRQWKANKKSKDEIAEHKTMLEQILDTASVAIFLVDLKGKIIHANKQMAEMFACSITDLYGMEYVDLVHPSERVIGRKRMLDLLESKVQSVDLERYYLRMDGKEFWGHLSGRRFYDIQGNELGLIGVIADINERKVAEEALKKSENQLSMVLQGSQLGFWDWNIISGEVKRNSRWAEMIGFTLEEIEFTVGNWDTLIHEDDRALAWQSINDHLAGITPMHAVEYRMRCKDGQWKWIRDRAMVVEYSLDGQPTRMCGTHEDITQQKMAEEERNNLEKQLLHAQKLESLGVLAGGIAHDFNNILMAILGNADLALMRINKESPATENLHKIEQAAARAADLAKQMLAYSGKGKFVVENIDLNLILEGMLHMLEVSISKKAVLRFNLHHDLPAVEADATQIRQIVMNLVINASEAIGDKSGVISISTGCIDCDKDYLKSAWLNTDIPEGRYVYFEVSDSGCGMDKETQSKLFDPFFTTKFTGRGLGMAAVQGIVRGHKGAIKVYSEPNNGSSFKVLLPVCTEVARQQVVDAGTVEFKGEGTILLVDDEETILDVGSQMIKELGFSAITAIDGRDAIERFKSQQGLFCVILDLTMPHMDGEQTFRELRIIDPSVKVVISSGYSEYEVTQKFAGKGLAGFIQKPFKLSTLKEVLQRI